MIFGSFVETVLMLHMENVRLDFLYRTVYSFIPAGRAGVNNRIYVLFVLSAAVLMADNVYFVFHPAQRGNKLV